MLFIQNSDIIIIVCSLVRPWMILTMDGDGAKEIINDGGRLFTGDEKETVR